MNAASNSNGNASVTRQPTERSNYGKLSEDEFLAHEAELAKTAIGCTLAELKADLAKAGDLKLWTHHYPWLSVGVAAATGFTIAAVVKKGDTAATAEEEEQDRQRLLRETAKAPYNSTGAGKKPKLGDSLLGSLFSLARTALEASLVSAIRAEGIERIHAASAPAQTAPPGVSRCATPVSTASNEPAATSAS